MYNHEPLEAAGLQLVKRLNANDVILADGKILELWTRTPHYAGYAVLIDAETYEFVSTFGDTYA